MPENTEEEKKRKKAILLFIDSWKQLKNEVERVKGEFEKTQQQQSPQQTAHSLLKIASFAKGPFGIITFTALIIVGILTIIRPTSENRTEQEENKENQVLSDTTHKASEKIKVIIVNGKKIPLSEVKESIGTECDRQTHYHAVNPKGATSIDETIVPDPGNCGYGKVNEVVITEVDSH